MLRAIDDAYIDGGIPTTDAVSGSDLTAARLQVSVQ